MGETNQTESIGQYRLEACIAEGNLARLCQGVDRTSGRRVMVRIVEPLACRNELVRASLEALRDPQHPRRTQDPHFVQILDAGIRGDSYYVVKEYFEALPLDRYLARQERPLHEKLRLARLILECLRAVHGHRMVHGDVKPQNILVGRDRNDKTTVKIALSDLATSTAHGMVSICGELLATPKYLSPEQTRGKSATDASDLFAAGVVLYEMFTGREPFPADTALGYLHSNAQAPFLPADRANPQLPADLAKLLARLLERQVEDRYRHAQSVLDDLDRVESALNGVTPPPVAPGSDSAFALRAVEHPRPDSFWRPIAIASLTALCLLLLAAIILMGVQLLRGPRLGEVRPRGWLPSPKSSDDYSPAAIKDFTSSAVPPAPPNEAEVIRKSVADLRARVESLVRNAQYDDALEALGQFTADPKNAAVAPALNEDMASVLVLKGVDLAETSPSAALELLRKAMKEYPNTTAAKKAAGPAAAILVVAATMLEQQGQAARAVETLEQVRKEYPGTAGAARAAELLPAVQWKLAQSLTATEPDRAAELMKPLLNAKLPETDMTALKRALGQLLLKRVDRELTQKQYAAAVDDLRVLREIGGADPATRGSILAKEPKALAALALQLKEQGKNAEAVAIWNDLKARYPAVYALQEHEAEMAPLIEAATPPPPAPVETAAALLNAAKASAKSGDSAAATAGLERLLASFPAAPEAAEAAELLASQKLSEARKMLSSGGKAEAVALLERILAEQPRTRSATQASALLERIEAAPQGMVYVPAGEFIMGLSPERLAEIVKRFGVPSFMIADWFSMQTPARMVDAPGFYVDQYEVTNAEYMAYMQATGATPPADPMRQEKPADFDKLPVTGVTFEEASAYAAWTGKRLPTEEEWEKAARGTDGRFFPWGDEFDATKCVTGLTTGPEPVGMCPEGASPYGVQDMVGNVAEWTTSAFMPYPGASETPAAADETLMVVRGAAWDELSKEFCVVTVRKGVDPGKRSATVGFRCVKDVK